jgi:hypothetical protein
LDGNHGFICNELAPIQCTPLHHVTSCSLLHSTFPSCLLCVARSPSFYSFIVTCDVPFCLLLALNKNRAINRDMNCAHQAYRRLQNPSLRHVCVEVFMKGRHPATVISPGPSMSHRFKFKAFKC